MILRASLYANAILLVACVFLFAMWQYADAQNARNEARAGRAEVKAIRESIAKRDENAKWLAALRGRLPKAGRKVSDAVHTSPSGCSVAPAVGNSLRESIDQGNAARRSADALP